MFPGHHASPSNSGFTGQQQSQDVPPTNNTGFFFSYTTAVASSISYIAPPAASAAPRVGYAQQSPYHPNHANLNTNLHSRPPPPLMNFFRVPTYRNIRVFGTASPQNLPLTRPPSTYLHNNASNNQMLMLEVENHARPALTYANGFESFPNSSNSVISVENNFHPNNSPSIAVAVSTTNNNKTAESQSTHKTLDYSTVNSGNPQIESPNSDDESLLESPISVNVSNSSKQQIESTIFEEEQQPVESMCSNQQQKESTNASKKQQTELIVSKTVEEESPESHTHHTAADLRGCDITQEQQDQQKNFSSNSNSQLQIGTTNSNQHQKHPENQIESIPSSNSNKTDSSESIELLPMSEDEESYEEQHKEDMGKNWRIRMLFNGQVKDADLPAGCGRPQTNQGKQFPYPECASAEPHPLGEWESVSDDEEEKQQEAPVQQRQRNAKRNVAGIPLLKETAAAPSTSIAKVHNSSYGYVLPNGTTWVRRRPADGSEQLQHLKRQQQQQKVVAGPSSSSSAGVAPPTTIPNSKLFTGPNTTIATTKAMRPTPVPNFAAPTRPVVPPTTARASTMTLQQQPKAFGKGNASNTRFTNNSLRIMNGKRLYAGNRDCYQFVQTGACQNGIFCIYEHNGGMEHANQRICNRLLRGLCREQDDNCPGGPHSPLLPHQRPVCDFFLRMSCSRGKDNCPYVHCRHTAGTEPCVDFNRGCCLRGPLCDNVHRYFYSTIKQKSSDQQQHQKMASKNVPTHPNPNPANNQENPPLQRQSRQTPTPPNPTKSASPLPASLQWIT